MPKVTGKGGMPALGSVDSTHRLSTRWTARGPVLQSWPKKRGKAKEGYDYYRQAEFGIAARMASNGIALDQETATINAKTQGRVWRDISTMAAMGTYYRIIYADGQEAVSWRMANPNPQLVLDMVTDEHGAILVRAPIGWIGVSPGLPGQQLYMGQPEDPAPIVWAGPAAPGRSGGLLQPATAPNATATSGNAWQGDSFDATDVVSITELWAWLASPPAGTYQAALATLSGTGSTGTLTGLTKSLPKTIAAFSGTLLMRFQFASPPPTAPGTRQALLVGRTDGANTYVLPLRYYSSSPALPYLPATWRTVVRVPKAVPVVGDAYDTQSSTAALFGKLIGIG